jgi:hypothetical protein
VRAGYQRQMHAALVIAFYVLVAVLLIRVRRVTLAAAALAMTGCLVVARIAQAIVSSSDVAGYTALGLVVAVVMVGLAVEFGSWSSDDEDSGAADASE